MGAVNKVINIARAEVGYFEKRSNSQLDDPSLQGQPWCDMLVGWCFVQALGKVDAKRFLCGGFSAYTPTSAQYYKDRRQYHKPDPRQGDQIFFRGSDRINHTGIVTEIAMTYSDALLRYNL